MKFYHVIDNKRNTGLTIATEISGSIKGEELVECAVSYCAPIEKNFSRPKGRIIAQSRLSSQRELPLFKRFNFRIESRRGLKAQILTSLRVALNIDWARAL